MGKRGDKPSETPNAAQAFQDYVALGPGRSLEALHAAYLKRARTVPNDTPPTKRLPTLKQWSSDHRWQERLAEAVNAQTEAMLERAAELDAKTFLRTSELLAERAHYTDAGHLDAVIKMRESVRKPQPRKHEFSGKIEIDHVLREIAAEAAAAVGLDEAEVLAEVERHLAKGRA